MATQLSFAIYNPALLPPDVLLAEFTARRPMLDTLVDIVRQNLPGHPPQHVLIIGVRGMGKTTTLLAIAHTINRDAALRAQWQPVIFDEESRRVGDLADFWLEAIRQWEDAVQDSVDRVSQLLDQTGPDFEERCKNVFLNLVDRSGRRALLLIDNLNDLLASIKEPEQLHRLRAFLMKDSRVMIIGGATRYSKEITDIDQPFYEFFRAFDLHPLSLEEMKECLLAMAKNREQKSIEHTLEKQAGTVKALHLLTGGNPRLIKIFYRLLAEGLRGDVRSDLERLLDEYTPYFKAIVDALPQQQQRLFDAIALAWDPVEVATIARVTRVPSNQVSAQINSLIKMGHIVEAAGSPKRKTYLLADRFSNIHYLMRHGRAARNRFDWFIALVGLVFTDRKLPATLAKVARQTVECGPEGFRDTREFLHCALTHAKSLEARRKLLHATLRASWNKRTLESLSNWLDLSEAKIHLPEVEIVAFFGQMPATLRRKLGYKPDDPWWWFRLTDFLEEKQQWILAEAAYRKAIEIDPRFAGAWSHLGHLLAKFPDRQSEMEKAFRMAIEIDPRDAFSWVRLGITLREINRNNESEEAFRKAIELNPEPKIAGWAWGNLGFLLQDLNRNVEAEAANRKAIELDPEDPYSWTQLGNLLYGLDRYTEAEQTFRKAIERDPNYGHAYTYLGNLLVELKKIDEAEEYLRKATEVNPKDTFALRCLASFILHRQNKLDEAVRLYRKAVDIDPSDGLLWGHLGDAVSLLPKHQAEAEAAYRKAIELNPAVGFLRSSLAKFVAKQTGRQLEAAENAVKGLLLAPDDQYSRSVLIHVCAESVENWLAILPTIAAWCLANPKATEVFEVAIEGFLRVARLGKPAEASKILSDLPDPIPFETLRDAFAAHADRNHLNRLAPERQHLVLELLKRFEPETPAPVHGSK